MMICDKYTDYSGGYFFVMQISGDYHSMLQNKPGTWLANEAGK